MATDYHVGSDGYGSDGNSGLTRDAPLDTIQAGLNKAVVPGDRVIMLPGFHTPSAVFTMRPSTEPNGTALAKCELRGDSEGFAVIDVTGLGNEGIRIRDGLSYWKLANFGIRGANNQNVVISDYGGERPHHIEMEDVMFSDVPGTDQGLLVGNADNITCTRCTGVLVSLQFGSESQEWNPNGTTIDSCLVFGVPNGKDGIKVSSFNLNTYIVDTTCHSCTDAGFDIAGQNLHCLRCVAYNCTSTGFKVFGYAGTKDRDTLFEHCVAYVTDNTPVGDNAGWQISTRTEDTSDTVAMLRHCTAFNCKSGMILTRAGAYETEVYLTCQNCIGYATSSSNRALSHSLGDAAALHYSTNSDNNCWFNSDGGAPVLDSDGTTYSNADVNDGTWAAASGADGDSFAEDPLFTDEATYDLTLTADSPCVDAGLSYGQPFTGSGPDIGAYQRVPGAAVPRTIFSLLDGVRDYLADNVEGLGTRNIYIHLEPTRSTPFTVGQQAVVLMPASASEVGGFRGGLEWKVFAFEVRCIVRQQTDAPTDDREAARRILGDLPYRVRDGLRNQFLSGAAAVDEPIHLVSIGTARIDEFEDGSRVAMVSLGFRCSVVDGVAEDLVP